MPCKASKELFFKNFKGRGCHAKRQKNSVLKFLGREEIMQMRQKNSFLIFTSIDIGYCAGRKGDKKTRIKKWILEEGYVSREYRYWQN